MLPSAGLPPDRRPQGLFRDTKMMGIGNGHVNGRRQDLCTLGRMMVDQLPLNDMAPGKYTTPIERNKYRACLFCITVSPEENVFYSVQLFRCDTLDSSYNILYWVATAPTVRCGKRVRNIP